MNVDLVQKNEVFLNKNEALANANLSLTKQVDEVQTKAQADKER